MKIDIKIPSVGESVQEAVLAQWYKKEGDHVQKDEPLFVIETDKVTLEVPAEASGRLHILVAEGETVAIGTVVGTIDTEKVAAEAEKKAGPEKVAVAPAQKTEPAAERAPQELKIAETGAPAQNVSFAEKVFLSPSVRRLVAEKGIDINKISGSGPGGRITKGDVLLYLESDQSKAAQVRLNAKSSGPEEVLAQSSPTSSPPSPPFDAAASEIKENVTPVCVLPDQETVTVKPMTPIRRRIAERLLAAKQNTAMLTTFNEIDMSHVMTIRDRYKDAFYQKYKVRLGFMSFFVKAVVEQLRQMPDMNARVDGNNLIYHHYYHIGVAIGAERGLVVPVIRHADQLGFAQIETRIIEFVNKINENRLQLEDLEGGTFSITNGGVYGSLLSTPILNTPESGILGMHKIEQRPVVIGNEIVIRPMMYVALSYDHRIVDGKTAVTFLRNMKELIEDPERIMMEI